MRRDSDSRYYHLVQFYGLRKLQLWNDNATHFTDLPMYSSFYKTLMPHVSYQWLCIVKNQWVFSLAPLNRLNYIVTKDVSTDSIVIDFLGYLHICHDDLGSLTCPPYMKNATYF